MFKMRYFNNKFSKIAKGTLRRQRPINLRFW